MKFKSLLLACGVSLAALPILAQGDVTQVRVINALPQSQGISVSIGGNQLFDGVKFNDISRYQAMTKQDDQTVLIQNGAQQLKTNETLDFDDDDENYTILVTPDPQGPNPKVVVLDSDREDVDSDEVEINLINASPNHKSIKLRLNDDVKESGVNYADDGDTDVKPGVYNLAVLDASGNDTVIANRSVKLQGGTAITVLLTAQNQVKIINDMAPQQEIDGGATLHPNQNTTASQPSVTQPAGTQPNVNTQAPATMTTPAMSM